MINGIDLKIMNYLQQNSRTSNAEIARQVGLAPSAVFERIRKLEEKEILQGYTARIDPHAVGLGLVAFTFVRSNDRPGGIRTAELLAEIPEVLEVHHVALARGAAADPAQLGGGDRRGWTSPSRRQRRGRVGGDSCAFGPDRSSRRDGSDLDGGARRSAAARREDATGAGRCRARARSRR